MFKPGWGHLVPSHSSWSAVSTCPLLHQQSFDGPMLGLDYRTPNTRM